MPHRRKKNNQKIPKNYTPVSKGHCKVSEIIDVIYYNIKTNWMSEVEFDEVYKQVKKKLLKDKNA